MDHSPGSRSGHKIKQLQRLERLGLAIRELRSAKAVNGTIAVRESELAALPSNLGSEVDAARSASNEVRKMVAEGLGILIPADLRIETYIELVRDYQPRITAAVNSTTSNSANLAELSKVIASVNDEIERIKGLKRYAVLEAALGFYKNNGLLVGGALVAATMGLAGSLLGCATAGLLTAGTKLAKQAGWTKSNPAFQRLGRMIVRDIQPFTELLLRSYLGGSAPSISALSLRKRIAAVSGRKRNR